MEGVIDPYTWLAALSSAVVLYVLLLLAHRRIPRLPPADSINELRADFLDLADQFAEFVEKHDADMGRYHAKVGSLRRKLRRLQEEEGDFEEDDESEAAPPPPPVLTLPNREAAKAEARARLKQLRGNA